MNIYQLMLEARINLHKEEALGNLSREDAIEIVRSKFHATSERAFVGIGDNGDMLIASKPQTKEEINGWVFDNCYRGELVGTVPADRIASWCDECHEVFLSLFDEEFL